MRLTSMTGRPHLPVLSSVTGRIIAGFGLLVIILIAVVAGSAWLVREHRSDLAFWLLVTTGASGAVTGLAASALIARSILRPLSSLESAALAVMSLHMDRFNLIDDGAHYNLGDHLLRAVGERLASPMREGDTVARVGDDEFIVLLPGTAEAADAAKIAERILEALRPPFHFDGQEVHATTSIGISLYPYDGGDAATLLKNADAAMCRAKEKGRTNYQLYTPATAAKRYDRRPLRVGGTAGPVLGSPSEVPSVRSQP